jgi:hypothetical protein
MCRDDCNYVAVNVYFKLELVHLRRSTSRRTQADGTVELH